MKKITLLFLFLISGFSAFAQFPAPYCGPITFTNNEEPITLVNFAGINNVSPSALAGVAHEDFTSIVGNVTAGDTYPITLKGNTDGNFNTNLSVFIDWNQNGVFTDAGETYNIGSILNSTGEDAIVLNGSIVASASALSGNTRMRVVKKFNNSTTVFPDSCNTGGGGWGEAEDYTLAVTSILPCLGNTFMWPETAVTTGACDGFTSTLISDESYAGDYAEINVVTGETYMFSSSVATDFFTISTDGNLTAAGSGVSPFTWVSTVTGVIRLNINTDSSCGTQDEFRETSVICGIPCLNGGLYPAATYTPAVCDGLTVNEINADAWAGEFANVNVFALVPYTFGSSVATDYITIASADGTTIYSVGTGTASYTPTADGVIRMYIHTDAACGTENVDRIRTVVCSATVVAPECAINPMPADGAVDVPVPGGVMNFSWSPSPTGEVPTGYNIYLGDSVATLALALPNYPDTTVGGTGFAYSTTFYWLAVPINAAGEAIGCTGTPWSFTTEPDPALANTIFDNGTFSVAPNPVKDILNITFSQNIEKVQVMNLLGQEVMTKAINATQSQVDMSSLAQGTYLVKVTADGQVKTIKVIKE